MRVLRLNKCDNIISFSLPVYSRHVPDDKWLPGSAVCEYRKRQENAVKFMVPQFVGLVSENVWGNWFESFV